MTNRLYIKYFLAFFLTSLSSENSFAANTPAYPKLTMHGETYENSCAPKQKKKLIISIRKNITNGSRTLQNAIELILCGVQNSHNTERMSNLIDEVVVISYEGTGEEKFTADSKKKTDIVKDIMARGKAWDASLIFDDNEVKLQYFADEACVKSVKLRYLKNSWLVNGIGEACD